MFPQMSRRKFLLTLSAIGASGYLGFHFWGKDKKNKQELFAVCDVSGDIPAGNYSTVPGSLKVFSVDGSVDMLTHLPFRGHSIVVKPGTSELMVFEKWGRFAALVDWRKRQLIKLFDHGTNKRFFGHGAYTADGKYLFSSEMDDIKKIGILGVRDGVSGEIIRYYPTNGVYPHDCQLAPDEKSIWVVNSRGIFPGYKPEDMPNCLKNNSSNLVRIDLATGAVSQEVLFSTPGSYFGHFQRYEDGSFILVGGSCDKYVNELDSKPSRIAYWSPVSGIKEIYPLPGQETPYTAEITNVLLYGQEAFANVRPVGKGLRIIPKEGHIDAAYEFAPSSTGISLSSSGGRDRLVISTRDEPKSIYSFDLASHQVSNLGIRGGMGTHICRIQG